MKHRLPWDLLDLDEQQAIWDGIIARLRRTGARRLLDELGCQGITVRREGDLLVMQGDFDDKHLRLLSFYAVEVADLLRGKHGQEEIATEGQVSGLRSGDGHSLEAVEQSARCSLPLMRRANGSGSSETTLPANANG